MIYTLTPNPAVDRELTVSSMQMDSVLRATESRVDLGGKGFNVSRLLRGLDTESTAMGFLGGGAGKMLEQGLKGLGILTDFVWVEGETRTNISIVTPAHEHYLKVNEPGPTVSPDSQQLLLDRIAAVTQPGDWWVLAGSMPPGVREDLYARILAILNQHGAYAILDSSGEPFRIGCREKPFLVKPNAEEVKAVTGLPMGTPQEIAAGAEAVRRIGARNVVVSMGKDGALGCSGDGSWLARSPRIQEKNPIGAGDSMVGGLVWALSNGKPFQEALAWGIACGAATASLSGTEVGSRPLIETLYRQVQLSPL